VELPRLEPLWQEYQDRGFSVIVVEARRDTERAAKFIEENKLTYHLLETEENNDVVDEIFGVEWFPTSYLIDRTGRVMYCHIGFEEGDEEGLEKEILELFDGSEQASR
jgi:peroxiredoxin